MRAYQSLLLPGLVGLVLLFSTGFVSAQQAGEGVDPVAINEKDDGYRGIWYFNQKSNDQYVYKYSGGLGTYCAKHQPFAVYAPQVNKTFFCFGGDTKDEERELIHLVSYYDHETGLVPRPTVLLNKQTSDAHDNPVISLDDEGYIWIFSTSHGRGRPSYIHRSTEPYSADRFERVPATYQKDGEDQLITNFSYMQAWHLPGQGFLCFFTRYGDPAQRTNMFMSSPDGRRYSSWQRLAAIEMGHYQISTTDGGKGAAAFNFHPDGKGLNWRTNLYYMETRDFGETWCNAAGERLEPMLTDPENPALVHDYQAEGLNVYLKDIRIDRGGHPVILFLTSKGYESGPDNDPRTWRVACWTGEDWRIHDVTTSDNNYDMGSLYLEPGHGDGETDETWRIIAPTEPGPQRYNPGGEVAMWISRDRGRTWQKDRQLTENSEMNHTYVRRPVNAHRDFYALWADGHGRQPSPSRLYFCDRDGDVFMLPPKMESDFTRPERIAP